MDKSLYTRAHQTLATILKELREQRGLRQEDLAELLGEHQSFVSRYESGQRRLDLVELRAICGALDIALITLVRRYEKTVGDQ